MKIEGYIPQREVKHEAKTDSLKKAVGAFQRKFPMARIEAVDDKFVEGICESCEMPILEGEEYRHDSEGIVWHKGNCPK